MMATQQVAAAHGMTCGSAVTAAQRTAAQPWRHGMRRCGSNLMGSSTLLHDTQPCTGNTHQQSIISLEILESPFLKKRWFLEHLELI